MSHSVLFLCTGNSARSIMAEALLNQIGAGRFRAYSAGSHPAGRVNPFALHMLARAQIPAEGLRSKAWDEFAVPGAPVLDFVITVCDGAAGESCPVWPGRPTTAHWSVEDPAAVDGDDAVKMQAFLQAFRVLEHRIHLLTALPVTNLDRARMQQIGASLPRA